MPLAHSLTASLPVVQSDSTHATPPPCVAIKLTFHFPARRTALRARRRGSAAAPAVNDVMNDVRKATPTVQSVMPVGGDTGDDDAAGVELWSTVMLRSGVDLGLCMALASRLERCRDIS